MAGGANTTRLAVEVLPLPPSVDVTVTLLFCVPAVTPVTFSDSIHDVLTAKLAPDKLTEVPPAATVPPHVLVSPTGDATARPAGKLSMNATPVSGMVFEPGLTRVNVKLVEPFSGMLAAPNALAMAGGAATAKVAEAVLPAPPLVDVTAAVVLV